MEVTWLSPQEAADRAGVDLSYLARLAELGILAPSESDRYSNRDVRRMVLAQSLEAAGITLESVVAAIQNGSLSLDFLDEPSYERFTALASETLQEVSDHPMISSGKTSWISCHFSSYRYPRDFKTSPLSGCSASTAIAPVG